MNMKIFLYPPGLTASVRRFGWLVGLGSLSLLNLLTADTALAAQGRDFAGSYELSDAIDLGEQVQGTFTVHVFNYSDADVIGATVKLEGSLLPGTTYGDFYDIYIPDRDSVRLSTYLSIPKQEYDYWRKGGRPGLHVEFMDAIEGAIRRPVELIGMPLGQGE